MASRDQVRLLSAGGHSHLVDGQGRTARQWALQGGHSAVVQILDEHCAVAAGLPTQIINAVYAVVSDLFPGITRD